MKLQDKTNYDVGITRADPENVQRGPGCDQDGTPSPPKGCRLRILKWHKMNTFV